MEGVFEVEGKLIYKSGKAEAKTDDEAAQSEAPPTLPTYLLEKAPEEKEADIITPSGKAHNSQDEAAIRGTIIHKLLELAMQVKDIDKLKLDKLAQYIGANEDVTQEVWKVIDNPELKEIFTDYTLTETSIYGDAISGQIDLMLVKDKEIIIIDYKSGKIPYTIPDSYSTQLKHYKNSMLKIYPDKEIKTYILWTEQARLDKIS